MKKLLSSLFVVVAMCAAGQEATPLHVDMRECTGSPADRRITVTPLDGVLGFYGTNIVPAQEFTFRSSGGSADTNLVVGNYRFSFNGSTKSMQIFWPADPAITNLADPRIQRTGITLVYTTHLTNEGQNTSIAYTNGKGTNTTLYGNVYIRSEDSGSSIADFENGYLYRSNGGTRRQSLDWQSGLLGRSGTDITLDWINQSMFGRWSIEQLEGTSITGPLDFDGAGTVAAESGGLSLAVSGTKLDISDGSFDFTGGTLTGSGTGLSSLLATALLGTVPSANGGAGTVNGIVKANGAGLTSAAVAGTDYLTPSGNGSQLTSLSATALAGTIADARLSSNVPLKNGNNVFTGSNNIAGAFTGNGAALTNLPLATQTNSGAVSTNQYLNLELDENQNGLWQNPPFFIDTYYHWGSTATYSDYTNEIAGIHNGGLDGLWDFWYIIDDGWQGGVTNGILMPDNTKFPNATFSITNLCTYAHTNGVKVVLYMQPDPATSASGFPTLETNYEANAMAWRTWGVDAIKLDFNSPSPDVEERLNKARRLIRDSKKGFGKDRVLGIFTGVWSDTNIYSLPSSNLCMGAITELANATRIIPDNVGNGYPATWSNYVYRAIGEYNKFKLYNRPNHWLQLEVATGQTGEAGALGQIQTNISRGGISMQAMMGVVMDTQVAPNLADPGRYYYFANPALARLSGDVAHNPMYSISSNSIGSVWTRKLYDGSRAVAFVNHQFDTNTLFTTNVTWSQLGYQSNQLCGVYDVWNQAWVTNAYGGFGTTASNMSASVYFVYPTNTAAPVLTTVPISAYYNVWGNTIQWASVYPGATALMFFSGSGDNMAEFLIPKELVTTTTLQVRYRLHSNAAGTIPLYQLVGWEKANVSGNSAVVTGVTVAANTSIYYTNTFTVVANPDAVGIRLGITSASTNHLRLENIQVIAQ